MPEHSQFTFCARPPEPSQGRWRVVIAVERAGMSHSRVTSSPVWETRGQASAATKRALAYIEKHNEFPDLTQKW